MQGRDDGSIPSTGSMKTLVFKNNEVIRIDGKCQFPDCVETATVIAHDRDRDVVEFYCEAHADQAADVGHPEYHVGCPNCGCWFGVN